MRTARSSGRPGGGSPPGTPPLWTEFLTHAYENITLHQKWKIWSSEFLSGRVDFEVTRPVIGEWNPNLSEKPVSENVTGQFIRRPEVSQGLVHYWSSVFVSICHFLCDNSSCVLLRSQRRI